MNLRLDSNGDIIIGRGASRVSGAEYVSQLVTNRLRTELGEWELDRLVGIPWLGNLLSSNFDLGTIHNWVSATILSTEGVDRLDSLDLNVDRSRRSLRIEFTATTIHGGISTVVEV